MHAMGYTRERSWNYPYPGEIFTFQWFQPSGYPLSSPKKDTRILPPRSSVIRDYVGGKRYQYKPVNHWKVTWDPKRIRVLYNTSGYYLTCDPYAAPWSVSVTTLQQYFTFGGSLDESSAAFQEFVNDAFFNLTDSAKRQIDALNCLRDLLDIKNLVTQAKGLMFNTLRIVRELFSALGKHDWQRASLSTLRAVLFEASNASLLNRFGVQSALREFDHMRRRIENVQNGLDHIRRTCGKTFPAHYTRSYDISHPSEVLYGTDSKMGGYAIYFRNISEQVVFSASATIKNNLSRDVVDGLLGQLAAWSGGLGLNRGIQFLWDLVPYSFLVNWIVDVDKWIRNNLTIDQFGGFVNLADGGCSIKSVFTANLEIESPYLVGSPRTLGSLTVEQFQRKVGFKWGASVYLHSLSDLTSVQREILLELVGQRVFR